jgi:methylmalonyl-CoA mutase
MLYVTGHPAGGNSLPARLGTQPIYTVVWIMQTDSFPETDKADWLAQAMKDLKIGDITIYESLRWATPDGFPTEPYYTADDLNNLPPDAIQSAHSQGKTPGSTAENGWLNAPEYRVSDPKQDNNTLRQTLTAGADALVVDLGNEPTEIGSLARLLTGIKLSESPVFFRTTDAVGLVTALQQIAPYQLKGGLLTDSIAYYLQTGAAHAPLLAVVAEATRQSHDSPVFRTVCASGHVFHNAGATASQELAFLFANLTDQFDALTDAGLSIDQLAAKTILSVSVGTSYFTEIAKLRALRALWQRCITSYHSAFITRPPDRHYSAFVHAQTSTFYDAAATPNTNLLRATTEAMSAVIGGCNALTVHAYDSVMDSNNADLEQVAFGQRMARNVSLLLREESYLDKVADPSAGSYYLETLTHQLTEAAWTLFLQVEQLGGLLAAAKSGFVTEQIDAAYRAKLDAVEKGRVLVGVTQFRHDDPQPQTPPPINTPPIAILPDRRLAAAFE